MTQPYYSFIAAKRVNQQSTGIATETTAVHPMLFPFQRDVARWALAKGCCAVWLDTGLGKTFVQLEWARLLGVRTLIVAPLSVARQTVREGLKIGLTVQYARSQADIAGDGKLWITNYEMVSAFDLAQFGAIVLDESSILKALDGKTRQKLTKLCAHIPYRLCCSATPAPNDYTELGNHAHFLGVCTTAEMLAMFFVNANKQQGIVIGDRIYERKGSNKGGQEWRLKHHAEGRFFEWLASWAITMTKPSDLGYDDDGFILPPLTVTPTFVQAKHETDGQLFFTGLKGIGDRVAVRRQTLGARLAALVEIINGSEGQWIVWVGLDDEGTAATAALPGAVEVKGSDSPDSKATAFEAFQDGQYQILVTKARIGGLGLNMQCSHHMAFLGLSDSWEAYYQCIRREWRYKQESPVDVHIILSDAEAAIYKNVLRKDALAMRLRQKLIAAMREYERSELGLVQVRGTEYNTDVDFVLPTWVGGSDDLRVHLPGVRQGGQSQEKSIEYPGATEVLQSEVQRNSEAWPKAGANGKCRVPLSELREAGSGIQEPIGSQELHPEVLQPEVLRGSTKRSEQPSLGGRATFPEWIRGDLSA